MKNTLLLLLLFVLSSNSKAQTDPSIISWLQNTTETGTYYVSGNSTAIDNGIIYNCQQVEYSTNFVYITTTGVPAYPTGPFGDGNPSNASDQNAIYKFPRNPQQETGTQSTTTGGNIGVFINGVSLFDYRDGVAWNPNTNALCGGPGNPTCPGGPASNQDWTRDAVWAENDGFDCSKGHPANGNYHHHQNPSAFKWDLNVISDVCDLYDADGLYSIDASVHSPLIGFTYDGFPIYGAYGYANENGTGGITRIKSGYQLRNITVRTHHADGTDVDDGPPVNATYFLGFFREDYEWVAHPNDESYLDKHNGRFCITPEYPNGTYAYFATVDANWNSAYPYVVGPTFYGEYENRKVTSITESTTIYTPTITTCTLSASATSTDVTMNGGSDGTATAIASNAQGNLSYMWSTGQTTATITGLSAATYFVTITDDILPNCTAVAGVAVNQPSAQCNVTVTAIGMDVSTNGGNDGSATAIVSNAQGNISYLWSTGQTTATISGLIAGTYTVIITDDILPNCTVSDVITISQPPPCTITATVQGTDVTTNGGNDGTATAIVSNVQGDVSYVWSNNELTQTITGLTAGTYDVFVIDETIDNCFTTASVTIEEPNAPQCEIDASFSGTIPTEVYQVSQTIDANGTVATTSDVTFKANEVSLEDGFCVEFGGELLAEIDPCTTNAPPTNNNSNSVAANQTKNLTVLYNPLAELIIVQVNGLLRNDLVVSLYDADFKLVKETKIKQGSTIAYFDTQILYRGDYYIKTKDSIIPTTIPDK